jgi:hypothetical protein
MRVPPYLFFVFVVAYAILACVVFFSDRLAKSWVGLVIYAIGCVLVFLAFARNRKASGRESHGMAEQAQDERAAPTSPRDFTEHKSQIRDSIRRKKSDRRNGQE